MAVLSSSARIVFIDPATGHLSYRNAAGAIVDLESGGVSFPYTGDAEFIGNVSTTNSIAAPTALTATATGTAGNPDGDYQYVVTYVTAQGETNAGTASATVSPSAKQVSLTAIPVSSSALVTARKIYRNKAADGVGGTKYLVTTLNNNTATTSTDNTADVDLGAAAPAGNTAGGNLSVAAELRLNATPRMGFRASVDDGAIYVLGSSGLALVFEGNNGQIYAPTTLVLGIDPLGNAVPNITIQGTLVTIDGGKAKLAASKTALASLSIPAGTAPTSPAANDVWATTYALVARLDGVSRVLTAAAGHGEVLAQTSRSAAIASYTVGSVDATFAVSAHVTVTTSTTHSFSIDVSYTDINNNARTLILPMAQLAGAFITGGLITNVTGAGPYESPVMNIRCKAATAITIRPSAGTFTTVQYDAEAAILQIA